MPVQETSVISYLANLEKINNRQKECLIALKKIQPANNLMLSKFTGLPINQVVPRIYELRKKGLVRLHHIGVCPISHEQTRFYSIVSYYNEVLVY
jgi:hypothetical protein